MGEKPYFDFLRLLGDEKKMIFASVFVLHTVKEKQG